MPNQGDQTISAKPKPHNRLFGTMHFALISRVIGSRKFDSHWGRRSIDGSRDPGEGLQLISQTEARRLLEQHNGPVESFFESEEG